MNFSDYPIKKKSLGQHFLKDKTYAQKFASYSNPSEYYIIEIGPGDGAITQFLPQNTLLIEKDIRLFNILNEHGYNIINTPAEQFDFSQIKQPVQIISNLPFNVGTLILLHLSEYDNIKELILGFQKEVARRITANVNQRDYSSLSVFIDNIYTKEYLFTIPPGAFSPPPKVQTGVIRLRRRERPLTQNIKKLNKILKLSFSSPRKKAINNLKKIPEITDIFDECNISSNLRPNQLTIEDYVCIGEKIEL